MELGASDKALEEVAARVIFRNPNGFGFETEGMEVAQKFASLIAGKNILITGVAEGGLGAEVAKSIASASPHLLILSARSLARASPVAEQLAATYPDVRVKILEMDLGSLSSVRAASEKVDAVLDVVICNASVMAIPFGKTEDGFEMHFGINHLGHFLFVNRLLKEGKVKEGGRVVVVTSDGHRLCDVLWDDTSFQDGKTYDGWAAYGQSKTANNLMAIELARRLKTRNIQSYSLHPGVIAGTNLGTHLTPEHFADLHALDKKQGFDDWQLRVKTKQGGSATYLVAAFDTSISGYNGGYLEDCNVVQTLKPWAADTSAAERLWNMSEEMVGERF